MSRLRAAVLVSGFIGMTLPLMPLQQFFLWTSPRFAKRFPQAYHRMLAGLLGYRVTVEGNIPKGVPVLLAANHVSWIDIVVLSSVAPVSFIAKREVGEWPLFGALARLQRTVFVDRTVRHATGRSRDDIKERLQGNDVLVLFAEGTSSDGINVKQFKSSFFGAAALDDVRVVPVTLSYNKVNGLPMTRRQRPFYAWYGDMDMKPHLWESVQAGPIGITVKFHDPLTTKDRKELARQAEMQVRDSLARLLHGR